MKYLILHTPRSGSTYLCSLLHQTGVAGIVDIERCGFFIGLHPTIKAEQYPVYVQAQTTPNGVFGAKVGMFYFAKEMRHCHNLAEHILQDMDKFIWLRRRDTVAQGVSRYIASSTKRWHSKSPDNTQQAADPPYSRFKIAHFIAETKAEESRTEVLCEALNIHPLIIWYEDLIKEPSYIIASILDFLSIPTEGVSLRFKTLYHKLDNPNKAAYIKRFNEGL